MGAQARRLIAQEKKDQIGFMGRRGLKHVHTL